MYVSAQKTLLFFQNEEFSASSSARGAHADADDLRFRQLVTKIWEPPSQKLWQCEKIAKPKFGADTRQKLSAAAFDAAASNETLLTVAAS